LVEQRQQAEFRWLMHRTPDCLSGSLYDLPSAKAFLAFDYLPIDIEAALNNKQFYVLNFQTLFNKAFQ